MYVSLSNMWIILLPIYSLNCSINL
uniref:Uncharacterized protein n=1 Tax=Arundo donax TaxID=35708 RepID=A0A0A9DS82_ARUDO